MTTGMSDIRQRVMDLTRTNTILEELLKERTEELRLAKDTGDEAIRKLRQTQAQLVQSEKMASVGQLAAGIAHEINNPTGFVSSNLKTLEEYVKDIKSILIEYDEILNICGRISDEEMLKSVKKIEDDKKAMNISFLLDDIDLIISETQDGMKRIGKIVKDLKEFSHAGSDKPEYADINKGLEITLNIVWNELKYKAEIVSSYGDIPRVLCYPQQLNQVFMNLFINAAQAMEEKGIISVRTFTDNNSVVVEISDTGIGIPPGNLSRIFEPFFTTKPVGRGTGLGLSVAYAIIKKHGGYINTSSQVSKGSCFSVVIPVEYEELKKSLSGLAEGGNQGK